MKQVAVFDEGKFKPEAFSKLLVHDSPYFKIINFMRLSL